MVFLRKRILDTLMQIFIMLRHLVAEISRFKFDHYRAISTGASDLKLFLGGVYTQVKLTVRKYGQPIVNILTNCGLMTPYGVRDLGQHWLR